MIDELISVLTNPERESLRQNLSLIMGVELCWG